MQRLRFTACFLAVGWQRFKLLLQVIPSNDCKEPRGMAAAHGDHAEVPWQEQGARRGESQRHDVI